MFFRVNAKTLATLGVGLADGRSRLLNAAHVMHLSGVNGLVDAASLQKLDGDVNALVGASCETRTKFFVWSGKSAGWTVLPVWDGPRGRFVLMHGRSTACLLVNRDLCVTPPAKTASIKNVLELWSGMQRVKSVYGEFDMKSAATHVKSLLASAPHNAFPVTSLALQRSCLGGALAHALACSDTNCE